MTVRWLLGASAICIAATVAGCGTRSNVWNESLNVIGPTGSGNYLVWIDQTLGSAVILDPSGARPPLTLDIVTAPRAVASTPTELLVTGGPGTAPDLDIISVPGGVRRSLTMAGVYDNISVSPDSDYAILYYNPTATPAPGSVAARNNNEIAVLDLNKLTTTVLSLDTSSLAPEAIVFSPDHETAAVQMDGTIVFLRLDNPTVQTQIPLALSDGTPLHPSQVLFSTDPLGSFLYVQDSNDDNILSVSVSASPTAIAVSVNFLLLPGASGLLQMLIPEGTAFNGSIAALYTTAAFPAASCASSTTQATTCTSPAVALLDATGNTSNTIATPIAAATKMDNFSTGTVILWSSNSAAISGWTPLTNVVVSSQLPATPTGTPIATSGGELFTFPSVTTTAGTSAELTRVQITSSGDVLRLNQNPIVLAGPPESIAFDWRSDTLFISISVPRLGSGAAPDLGTTGGFGDNTAAIVTLDPVSLNIGGLVLDDDVTGGVGVIGPNVFAIHQSNIGDVTFFPVDNPTRGAAHRDLGFLLGNILNR